MKLRFVAVGAGKEFAEMPTFQTLFFFILLPPKMLESAFSLHKKEFINNLSTVLLHAVLGTAINFLLVGGCLCLANDYRPKYFPGYNTSSAEIFLFSSLISAVEPDSVLNIFESVGVSPKLHYLVKGESIINDGVSFVFYSMTDSFTKIEANGDTITSVNIVLGILSFFTISLGGLIIGMLLGIFSSWMSKHTDDKMHMVEPMVIFLSDYLAYLLAEMLGWSGVISLFGCALMQAQYGFKNLSDNALTFIQTGVGIAASTSDSIIFLYLGEKLYSNTTFDCWFILMATVICFFVRFIAVFLVSLITKDGDGDDDWRSRVVMSYAGIRGAVSFALASLHMDQMEEDYSKLGVSGDSAAMLASTTQILILSTTFIQGTTIR